LLQKWNLKKVAEQQERNLRMAGAKRKGAPERRKHPKAQHQFGICSNDLEEKTTKKQSTSK